LRNSLAKSGNLLVAAAQSRVVSTEDELLGRAQRSGANLRRVATIVLVGYIVAAAVLLLVKDSLGFGDELALAAAVMLVSVGVVMFIVTPRLPQMRARSLVDAERSIEQIYEVYEKELEQKDRK